MSDVIVIGEERETDSEVKEKIKHLLGTVKREGMDKLIKYLEYDCDFFEAPASGASKFHGCFDGGLAVHSLQVYKNLKKLNNAWGKKLTEDEMVIMAILHDLCKINVYKPAYIKNSDKRNSLYPYTKNDQYPYGHGEKSVDIIRDFIKLTEKEKLAIRWHMCAFERDAYQQYGDLAYKMYPEISWLYFADHYSSLQGK